VFGQVKRAVGELEDDFHLGPGLGKFGNQRRQMPAAEAESGIDAEQAARCFSAGRERAFEAFDVAQNLFAIFEITFALRRQAQAACGAVEQANAEACFQRGQAAADGGRGDSQRLCGGSEAGLAGQQAEKSEIGGVGHCCAQVNNELITQPL
jgi:hypothetical protein